jgi:hypothetical protein
MHICTNCGVTHTAGAGDATLLGTTLVAAGLTLLAFAAWRIAKNIATRRAARLAAA